MRPSFLDDMAWSMAEVYGAVTDRILINLAKYFPMISQGGEVLDDFNYQAKMLAQMGQVNKETIAIIAQSLGGADEALKGTIEAAIIEALKKEEPQLRKAAEAGLLRGAVEVSPNQLQAFRAYYQQAADKLNLVNTVMLESTQAAYTATVADVAQRIQRSQSYLNVAAGEVVTGVSSYNSAMHDAVQKMVKNGLTGFIDHGGHKWSPEAYVAMDIRTTLFNTSRAAIWERNQQYGNDLYQVSTHNGARPLCYPWQGKVISTSGRTGMTEDLDGNKIAIHAESEIESFRYGGGLFGVNCGHYPMTFIPGFSTIKGEPQDPEENAKTYEESQQQRALERKLREEKRDLEVMKAQGASPEEIKAQRARVKQADANIEQFCNDTGRARRKDREYAPVKAEFPEVPKTSTLREAPLSTAEKQARTGTLQMYDDAAEWAQDSFKSNMDELREGWANVPGQIEAFDKFEREIPSYEKTLKDAVKREEFSTRTSPGAVQQILQDGRMKSQIETGASNGYLDVEKRRQVTNTLFAGGERLELASSDYEIYGYLGDAPRAKMYGDSRIVLNKNKLMNRTTVTLGDSLELIDTGADPTPSLATNPKIYSGGARLFSDSVPNAKQRLNDIRQDFKSIGENGYLSGGNYVELQFHGGVTVDDIAYIEVPKSATNAADIAKLAEEKGVRIKWK